MFKPSIVFFALATVCCAVLFGISQKVTDGRAALVAIERDIRREQESMRVLEAEWSYLNQPERLEKLAHEHLNLKPMTGRQFVAIENIPEKSIEGLADAAGDKSRDEAKATPAAAKVVSKPALKPAPAKPVASAQKADPKKAAVPVVIKQTPPPRLAPQVKETVKAQPSSAPREAQNRDFGDLMKSLGVR